MTLGADALTSNRTEVAGTIDDAVELCYAKGWTDGLPVIPPTEEKVLQFLSFRWAPSLGRDRSGACEGPGDNG